MAEGNCVILRSRTHIPARMKSGEQVEIILTIANIGKSDHCYVKMYVEGHEVWSWDRELDEGSGMQFSILLTVTVNESRSIEVKFETGHFVDETGVAIDDMLSQWIYVEKPSIPSDLLLALATVGIGITAIGTAIYRGR